MLPSTSKFEHNHQTAQSADSRGQKRKKCNMPLTLDLPETCDNNNQSKNQMYENDGEPFCKLKSLNDIVNGSETSEKIAHSQCADNRYSIQSLLENIEKVSNNSIISANDFTLSDTALGMLDCIVASAKQNDVSNKSVDVRKSSEAKKPLSHGLAPVPSPEIIPLCSVSPDIIVLEYKKFTKIRIPKLLAEEASSLKSSTNLTIEKAVPLLEVQFRLSRSGSHPNAQALLTKHKWNTKDFLDWFRERRKQQKLSAADDPYGSELVDYEIELVPDYIHTLQSLPMNNGASTSNQSSKNRRFFKTPQRHVEQFNESGPSEVITINEESSSSSSSSSSLHSPTCSTEERNKASIDDKNFAIFQRNVAKIFGINNRSSKNTKQHKPQKLCSAVDPNDPDIRFIKNKVNVQSPGTKLKDNSEEASKNKKEEAIVDELYFEFCAKFLCSTEDLISDVAVDTAVVTNAEEINQSGDNSNVQ